MKTIYRIMDRVLGIFFYVSAVTVFLLMVITALDAVARYFFNTSWFDAIELTSIGLVFIIWLSMGLVTYNRGHVCVELFTSKMPSGLKRVSAAISSLVAAGMFFLIAQQGFIQALYSMKTGEFLGSMELPRYPAKFALALGCLLTALSFTLFFIETILGEGKKTKMDTLSE